MSHSQEAEKIDHWASFQVFERGLNGEARSYVHDMRKRAFEAFARQGLPSGKQEDWKYTQTNVLNQSTLHPRLCKNFMLSEEIKNTVKQQRTVWKNQIVLLNGQFSAELSSLSDFPKGVVIGSLAQAFSTHPGCIQRYFSSCVDENNSLALLNTSFSLDGLFIYLPKNVVIEDPIHVTVMSTPDAEAGCCYTRVLAVLEANSQIRIVEEHGDLASAYIKNDVCEIVLGPGAHFDHIQVVDLQEDSSQIFNTFVKQSADSSYRAWSVNLGGKMVRSQVKVSLQGKGAHCNLHGLDVGKGEDRIDNHLTVEHISPYCNSSQLYKGIFDENSVGSFYGKIHVDAGALKTDAAQANKSLLLSKSACANTRPQLEIYADDVKCTHGATVGQLDENALFYLRARGIDLAEAKNMLTFAFAQEILEKIPEQGMRAFLSDRILNKLSPEEK